MDADPIIATDAYIAGRVVAERDYWILTPHGLDPVYAQFGPGEDPAGPLADHGPTSLRAALYQAEPLAESLIMERISNPTDIRERMTQSASVVAARPSDYWGEHINDLARRLNFPTEDLVTVVADAAHAWNTDRRTANDTQLANATAVRQRLVEAMAAEHLPEDPAPNKSATPSEQPSIGKDHERRAPATAQLERAPRR